MITQRLKITGLSISEDGGSDSEPGGERVVLQVAATGDNLQLVGLNTSTMSAS
jgi:hypothetical protein